MGTVAPADVDLATTSESLAALGSPRNDDKHVSVEFHCTAFGKFHNIAVNPTELLVRSLPAHLAKSPLPSNVQLASASVLEVAALASKTTLSRMHSKIVPLPSLRSALEPKKSAPAERTASGNDLAPFSRVELPSTSAATAASVDTCCKVNAPRAVFVHFGVNAAVTRFELEIQGRNEATFSCPDEAGWSPVRCTIDEDPLLPVEHVRQTRLPVHRIASELCDAGYDVGVSSDAGRFVCNYVYYNSLQMAERNGSLSLFVHVPPTASQPLSVQLDFFSALLSTIAASVDVMNRTC